MRSQGWAEAAGGAEPDLNALAAPVFGRGGGLGAVILSVQGPAARMGASRTAPRCCRGSSMLLVSLSRALGG